MMKLKVTNRVTGEVWIEENERHSWEKLCLDMMKADDRIHLIWCDIWKIVKIDGDWIMLDECGHWETISDIYDIVKVKKHE